MTVPLAPTEELAVPREAPPDRDPVTLWLGARPAWLRWLLYLLGGVLILSLAKSISGVEPLTAANTFRSALELSVPIGMAALGGLWAERAGVVNIGLEGMMVLGTWFGAWGAIQYGPWWGLVLGVVGGAVGGLLHAIATVSFGVDHIVSGVAINILAAGATSFLTTIAYHGANNSSPDIPGAIGQVDLLPFLKTPLTNLAGQGRFFISDLAGLILGLTTGISWVVVIAVVLLPVSWFVLWRTPFGLRLRSVGEYPEAAETMGVKVYTMKYVAVTISGALAGLGGVALVLVFSGKFQVNQTSGRGFIGLAAMIFGNWRVGGLVLGSGLFGFMDAMQSQVDATAHAILLVAAMLLAVIAAHALLNRRMKRAVIVAVVAALFAFWYATSDSIPTELIPVLPHITTLAVLVFSAQRLRPPAADGRIFRRSR